MERPVRRFGGREVEVVDDMGDVVVEACRQVARCRKAQFAEFGENVVEVGVVDQGGVEEASDAESERNAADAADHDHCGAE